MHLINNLIITLVTTLNKWYCNKQKEVFYMENKVITTEELERLKRLEEKQKERYRKQNMYTNSIYDRINFTVPAGKKKEIEELAKQKNKTLNKYVSEVVLLTLVNNDVNNALNNNTYANENVFIIPEDLNDKIKMFSDDVIDYIKTAIYEKLELDEQIAMDLEQEEQEQPQIEPITEPIEEVPQGYPKEPETARREPITEDLRELQKLINQKKAEQGRNGKQIPEDEEKEKLRQESLIKANMDY